MIFKICGLKNKESLFCCEENNADFFGMIFYEKSPRNITFNEAETLIITSKEMKIRPVGVFVDHEINVDTCPNDPPQHARCDAESE